MKYTSADRGGIGANEWVELPERCIGSYPEYITLHKTFSM